MIPRDKLCKENNSARVKVFLYMSFTLPILPEKDSYVIKKPILKDPTVEINSILSVVLA
jgi:hypothetical protein